MTGELAAIMISWIRLKLATAAAASEALALGSRLSAHTRAACRKPVKSPGLLASNRPCHCRPLHTRRCFVGNFAALSFNEARFFTPKATTAISSREFVCV